MTEAVDNNDNPIRFFWWCRECGWWTEVNLSGICADCRNDRGSDRRGAEPEDLARLARCGRCTP